MGSKLVVDAIAFASRPISRTIRKGKLIPTSIGAVTGLAAGVGGGLSTHIPFVATGLVGAIAGAFTAALVFKRPPALPAEDESSSEPRCPGAVRMAWAHSIGDIHGMTVLLENALYVVRDDDQPWEQVLQQFGRGEVPDLPAGTLIGLDDVQRLEIADQMSGMLEVFYSEKGQTRRNWMTFGGRREIEQFVGLLEEHYGQPFHRGERPVHGFDAIVAPLIPLVLIILVVGVAVWLSAHWTAHPPPFPRGRAEQDSLVAALVWLGPLRVLLVGAVPVLGLAGWLCSRLISPPWVPVFARSAEGLQFER